jgi:hypothetical protein
MEIPLGYLQVKAAMKEPKTRPRTKRKRMYINHSSINETGVLDTKKEIKRGDRY